MTVTSFERKNSEVIQMLHESSALRVVDTVSGLPVYGMRFFDVLAALDYIENADPVCATCGLHFTRASIHSITSSGGGWMLKFPHDCKAGRSRLMSGPVAA
jgi:hypothetical protein